ncbi:protein kinase [Streptomyces sp. NPDC020983]|uniref:protein kinase n=1 Tax=Streptomyces sp. NPDC020983 TaxID=3365106 RepID=UPI0037ADCBE3
MIVEREISELVSACAGEVLSLRPTRYGFSSDLTALAECERGAFFVKAMRNRPGGRRDSLMRERDINPFVRDVAPELRWYAEDEAWCVLGFEPVEGRPSDIEPGSADLGLIADLVSAVGALELPDVARHWPETRCDAYVADAGDAGWFRGDTLLHTDVNADNVLIGAQRAWLVDWSWPTRGAGFIDPACFVLQLVAAGHEPAEAEAWASRCPAWTEADPRAIDAFARADVRMHEAFAACRPEADWLRALAAGAREWAAHRGL